MWVLETAFCHDHVLHAMPFCIEVLYQYLVPRNYHNVAALFCCPSQFYAQISCIYIVVTFICTRRGYYFTTTTTIKGRLEFKFCFDDGDACDFYAALVAQ